VRERTLAPLGLKPLILVHVPERRREKRGRLKGCSSQ